MGCDFGGYFLIRKEESAAVRGAAGAPGALPHASGHAAARGGGGGGGGGGSGG